MKVKLTIATKAKCSECGGDKTSEQPERVIEGGEIHCADNGVYLTTGGLNLAWNQVAWLKIEPLKEAQ